jgi:hypothetical protein
MNNMKRSTDMSKKIKVIGLIIMMIIFMSGCSNGSINWNQASQELESVKVEIVETIQSKEGIEYTLIFKNNSIYNIKKLSMSYSYPIKTSTGHKGNNNNIKAENIHEEVKSGHEFEYCVFIPNEYFDGKGLDIERLHVCATV